MTEGRASGAADRRPRASARHLLCLGRARVPRGAGPARRIGDGDQAAGAGRGRDGADDGRAPVGAHGGGGLRRVLLQPAGDRSVGERILYAYNDDGTITTVVQIFYTGPSETFAWILPVPAEPTVDVGTDALFTALEGATAPRFELDYRTVGTCRSDPYCSYWDEDTAYAGGGRARTARRETGARRPPRRSTYGCARTSGPTTWPCSRPGAATRSAPGSRTTTTRSPSRPAPSSTTTWR
ncbi:MAG: DUF2330 domain-containing protein [Sandaracinaceae bacterium]|nr:DUF2330 domain-containing protein [Sandaracinaceae bacterium]